MFGRMKSASAKTALAALMKVLRGASRLAGALLLATLGSGPLRAQAPPEKLVISYVPGNAIYWDIDAAIAEAIQILQKYTKREADLLAPIHDLYVAKDAILSRDGAVVVADVDKVIAQMAENGAVPKGTVVSPGLYLLPKELGGLAR
jgi:N-terminal of Par3 and HAL proteins